MSKRILSSAARSCRIIVNQKIKTDEQTSEVNSETFENDQRNEC